MKNLVCLFFAMIMVLNVFALGSSPNKKKKEKSFNADELYMSKNDGDFSFSERKEKRRRRNRYQCIGTPINWNYGGYYPSYGYSSYYGYGYGNYGYYGSTYFSYMTYPMYGFGNFGYGYGYNYPMWNWGMYSGYYGSGMFFSFGCPGWYGGWSGYGYYGSYGYSSYNYIYKDSYNNHSNSGNRNYGHRGTTVSSSLNTNQNNSGGRQVERKSEIPVAMSAPEKRHEDIYSKPVSVGNPYEKLDAKNAHKANVASVSNSVGVSHERFTGGGSVNNAVSNQRGNVVQHTRTFSTPAQPSSQAVHNYQSGNSVASHQNAQPNYQQGNAGIHYGNVPVQHSSSTQNHAPAHSSAPVQHAPAQGIPSHQVFNGGGHSGGGSSFSGGGHTGHR